MNKYLLSTGETTYKKEDYIIDLFRLYLRVFPKDIPHDDDFGFDFSLGGIMKSEFEIKVKWKVESLINKVIDRLNDKSLEISIASLDIIDEQNVKLILKVNEIYSDNFFINLYEETDE